MAESRNEWVEEWVEERRKECVKFTVAAIPEWRVCCNTCEKLVPVGKHIYRDFEGEEFCDECFSIRHESAGYEALIQKERADEDNWGESQI
tara:strand:+ start:706 stop:978 length:273 start_codon:yes stop_codon:yes gene_type:complete